MHTESSSVSWAVVAQLLGPGDPGRSLALVYRMAIQAVNSKVLRFGLRLAAIALCGCTSEPPAGTQLPRNATESEFPSDLERLPGESTIILSGDEGELVLSQGSVLTADGAACPHAFVALDQDSDGATRRCLITRSDALGNYVIRGASRTNTSNMVWAATEEGQLGMSWNSEDTVTIRLQSGSTVLYVRASDGSPIENAVVTAYQGSIDDIAEAVPPNLRTYLRRTTDQDGMAEFPSTLGHNDIGFKVCVSGCPGMMRAGYSSRDNNLFVIGAASKTGKNIVDTIRAELFSDLADDRRLNFGYLDSLPPYLNASTRDKQPYDVPTNRVAGRVSPPGPHTTARADPHTAVQRSGASSAQRVLTPSNPCSASHALVSPTPLAMVLAMCR